MKPFFKNNIKFFAGMLVGLVISSISVYALTIASKDVSYDNTISGIEKTNVQDAIDELYTKLSNQKLKLSDFTVKTSWSAGTRLAPRTSSIQLDPGQYLVFATSHHTLITSTKNQPENSTTVATPSVTGDNGECSDVNQIRQLAPATAVITESKYLNTYIYEKIFLCNLTSSSTLKFSGNGSNAASNAYTTSVSVQAIKIK